MKTKILSIVSLLIILFLSSCTPQKVDEQREINYAINGEKLQILVIDSCEYIFVQQELVLGAHIKVIVSFVKKEIEQKSNKYENNINIRRTRKTIS
jgi:hypothetical protein